MAHPSNGSRPSTGSAAPSYSSRAERFEDEKRRIVESCFDPSKKDAEQRVIESYITHLRVEEDAMYPSEPAPRDAGPEQKKPRVIIIAVRNTGRVRMHKARENHNLSFSIGKTWNLEELEAIMSYNYLEPNAEEPRITNCQRAGPLGFTVTIGKPYYWSASTPKERDFFIASLFKIYKKYTKGREPRLEGFSDAEKQTMFRQTPSSSRNSLHNPPQPPLPAPPSKSTSNDNAPPHPPPPSAFSQTSLPLRSSASREPSDRAIATSDGFPPRPTPSYADMRRTPSEDRAGYRPRSPAARISQATYTSDRSAYPTDRSGFPNDRFNDQFHGADSSSLDDRSRRPIQDNQYTPASAAMTKSRAGASLSAFTDDPYGTGASSSWNRDRFSPTSPADTVSPNSVTPIRRQQQVDTSPLEPSRFDPTSQPLPERRRPPLNQQYPQRTEDATELRPSPLATAARTSSDRSRTDRIPGGFDTPTETNKSDHRHQPPPTPTPVSSLGPDPISTTRSAVSPPAITPRAEQIPIFGSGSRPEQVPDPEPEVQERVRVRERDREREREQEREQEPIPSPDPEPEQEQEEEKEEFRPGLGPMVKKKTGAADKFRKAANAVNAFKPRARGNQDALKIQTSPSKDTLSVKPFVSRNVSYEVSTPDILDTTKSKPGDSFPRREVSSSRILGSNEPQSADYTVQRQLPEKAPDVPLTKLRSRQQEKYLASLGIDTNMLSGKGIDFESALTDFGWNDSLIESKDLDRLQSDIKRELGRVEAGSWLGMMDQKDPRVDMVDKLLDRAIAECDELDGLLTIYSVELGTLNDDISFIEAQSQGLQVQTANQKILQSELHDLVGTISMDTRQMQALQRGSFDTDLEGMEQTLVGLYKAMMTLDPSSQDVVKTEQSDGKDDITAERTNLASMNALQEKRQEYQDESLRFVQRLAGRMEGKFNQTLSLAIPALTRSSKTQLQATACNALRSELWKYGPILLFARQMAYPTWQQLTENYAGVCMPLYHHVFKGAMDAQKKLLRVPTGDEADLLFTTAEKDTAPEGLAASATRKLTMKRSQILPRTVRTAGDKPVITQPGKKMPFEMFNDVISSWAPIMVMEQNFVVKLFHGTSLENLDFTDAVHAQPPDARGEPIDLKLPMQMDPNRAMAEHVTKVMSTIFGFWPAELRSLIDLIVINEPLQAVGILASLAVYSFPLHETSTEFVLRAMTEASTRLRTLFEKFVDDQIRAIEDTKVKIKKRKGVIGFVRTFPHFSMAVENMFNSVTKAAGWNASILEVRRMIDEAYERICQSMWSSLKQIAKESPSAAAATAAGSGGLVQGMDSEDKEALNYNVLLVENFNHFAIEVDIGEFEDSTLGKWRAKSLEEREEHLDMYLGQVIRRPLGKLLDFVESTEALLKDAKEKGTPAVAIAQKPSHSRAAAKKAMSGYDGREIRKGIEALRKRIEKHFGESDTDDAATQPLVTFVLDEASSEYINVLERVQRINRKIYAVAEGDRAVEVEWTKEDVKAAFKKQN